MKHLWCCDCGHEMDVTDNPPKFGYIIQCPKCKEVFTMVYPLSGGREWIRISKEQVEFHNLLDNNPED